MIFMTRILDMCNKDAFTLNIKNIVPNTFIQYNIIKYYGETIAIFGPHEQSYYSYFVKKFITKKDYVLSSQGKNTYLYKF